MIRHFNALARHAAQDVMDRNQLNGLSSEDVEDIIGFGLDGVVEASGESELPTQRKRRTIARSAIKRAAVSEKNRRQRAKEEQLIINNADAWGPRFS